jgi:spore maturation protein CgeB
MPTENNPNNKTRIAFIGKFTNLHDEEYIARSFETIGCEVYRIPQSLSPFDISKALENQPIDVILYCKWVCPPEVKKTIEILQRTGVKTVCWVFDIYFNYTREYQVKHASFFKSDFVFTTDNGNNERFKDLGINHYCIRQGIYRDECVLLPFEKIEHNITFVGSDNPIYPERSKIVKELNAHWVGKKNTGEARGIALNELYAVSGVVIGDSWYSPYYWSNRVVETLGRGGFLIHQEVEGLKEEYPYLITYPRGDIDKLKELINYYLTHEKERRDIIKQNFQWVKDNYTMDKQCQKLLNIINQ